MVTTNGESPFASGQWTIQQSPTTKYPTNGRRDPFLEKIDEYGKLDSAFNYVNSYQKQSIPTFSSSSLSSFQTQTTNPYEFLTNHINQNEYDANDKSRYEFNDESKLSSMTTERWRQNDKFILVENPLAAAINRTTKPEDILYHQQSGSSDEFQFPKVTYR